MKPDEYPSSTPLGTRPSADPTISRLTEIFGPPSKNIGLNCGPVENEALQSLVVKDKIGPFTATMLKPALTSLQSIFSEIQKTDPDLLKNVTNLGTICVRFGRGSSDLSTHAFGTAIDLRFDESAPSSASLADGTAKQAKVVLFFERAGWQWGGPSDYMHFQAGLPLIEKWIAAGELTSK